MSLVKNQHYVPQSYLKFFADKNERIYVFDKEKESVFPTNIRNIASERFFYDLPLYLLPEHAQLNLDKQMIEKFFSTDIEGNFLKLLNQVRVRFTMSRDPYSIFAITKEEKALLSILLTFQYMRTKDFRDTILNSQELIMQVLTDKLASFEIEDYQPGSLIVNRNKDLDAVEHAEFMFDPETINQFSKTFYEHIWFVGVNKTQLPLFTSDNPLVKYGHNKQNGLASPGIEIDFPISDRLVLIMAHRQSYAELGFFIENRFMPIDDVEGIKFLNWLQVKQARRQVYCKQNDFRLIDDMKLTHPDILMNKPKFQAITNRKLYE